MTSPKPRYIYKLVSATAPVPESLPEKLPVSDIDSRSGFIHLSTAPQVRNTLHYFFKAEPIVYVLRIEYDYVENDIRWEDPDGNVCGPRGGEGMFPVCFYDLGISCLHVGIIVLSSTALTLGNKASL
jgi:uncharacterized protein (DUF952 family)